jgi:hypothetical protein
VSSWEWQAAAWSRWAGTPGHDSHWHFRDLFFDAIVPAPGPLTLDERHFRSIRPLWGEAVTLLPADQL